ncbi:coiled-coil domain-containing protein [Glycomyces xiaoerkulensis]|uniref:hypothetical protein n=1 Tax=Glycomyces xiaoerkulensis TaxID=2038139 RepID=UPI000C261834|nr:hypothetical protein [Glycomyces xiaoerkulensis]
MSQTSSAATAPAPATTRYGPGTPEARDVADELEALAGRDELQQRARQLNSLAAALRGPEPPGPWSEIRLHEAFANVVLDAVVREGTSPLRWWYAARVTLVFIPLLCTWWGIHQAAGAYGRMLEGGAEPGAQSFFRQWLGGFDGTIWFSFGNMAVLVLLSIAGIIAVSVGIELKHRKLEAEAARSEARLRDRLDAALTDAALHLRSRPPETPESAADRLRRITDRAAELTGELTESADRVSAELSDLGAAGGAFRATVAEIADGAGAITSAAGDLRAALADIEQRLADQHRQSADLARRIAADLHDTTTDHYERTATVLTEVGRTVTDAVGAGERHRLNLALQVRDSQEAAAERVAERVVEGLAGLTDRLDQAGRAVTTELADTVEIGVDRTMLAQFRTIDDTNRQLTRTVADLTRAVDELARLLGARRLPARQSKTTRRSRWPFGRR